MSESKSKGFLGGLLSTVSAVGQTYIAGGVKGKRRNMGGCTPCAANARANAIYDRNLELMGKGVGKKKAKKSAKKAAPGKTNAAH